LGFEQFLHIIRLQDVAKLIKIPGVGKKMAQRLMIEMQNNINTKRFTEFFKTLESNGGQDAASGLNLANHITNDVQEALISLGYNAKEAILAIRSAEKSLQDCTKDVTISSETLLRTCLKFLSKVHHD
jgi:Holliday junction DNA helicase RuvA